MKQDISMMKETTLRRDQILDTAKIIINGEREGTYGKAEDSFASMSAVECVFEL